MITLNKDKLFYEFSALKPDNPPKPIQAYAQRISLLTNWVHEYLCQPHPKLGRPGPVCPFVPTALENRLLFVSFFPEVDEHTDDEELKEIVLQERDAFLQMEPRHGNSAQFKAFLLLFPNIPDRRSNQVIDSIQSSLQEDFVEKGLMVGEFHPGPPDKRGLWNEGFRPLYCPVPLLAIRHMVPTDILFLKDESTLVAEYLRIFGDLVPSKFQHLVEEAAERFEFDLPDKQLARSSAPTVIYCLEKNKVAYSVHRHSVLKTPIRRPEDFAAALNYDVERISKSLFVRDPKKEIYAILVFAATRRADLAGVAAFLGVPRLELADEHELETRVGHPPQAVTPIGVEGIDVLIDKDLFRFPTILTGAGVAKMEIEISPLDLSRLSGARVLSFVS